MSCCLASIWKVCLSQRTLCHLCQWNLRFFDCRPFRRRLQHFNSTGLLSNLDLDLDIRPARTTYLDHTLYGIAACPQLAFLVRSAKYCDDRLCVCVCPLAYLKNHNVHTSGNFPYAYMLPVAVSPSFDNTAMRYVFPVLWMTSCLSVMGYMAGDWKGISSKWLIRGQKGFYTASNRSTAYAYWLTKDRIGSKVWCLRLLCIPSWILRHSRCPFSRNLPPYGNIS